MKYNAISATGFSEEGGKMSSMTVFTDMEMANDKMAEKESEIVTIRGELEIVQKALKAQTRRCRQLVAEYTKRLQLKEQQYQGEKALREDQLGKVLRALLIFEARLRQEQKFISHQLEEKDCIIKKQNGHIKKLMSSQFCKNCNQYYSPSPHLESLESSSEYVATDYQDYQSSNFESLDSSSEIYATVSEKSYNTGKSIDNSCSGDEVPKAGCDSSKNIYKKNKFKDSLGRRNKKIPHRKSVGTYFEVLKLRNDSQCSNEDNTSNDYDNLDSLPPESITDKISIVSDRIENMFQYSEEDVNNSNSSINDHSILSVSECHTTIINKDDNDETRLVNNTEYNENEPLATTENRKLHIDENNKSENMEKSESKLSDSIPPFEGDGETNDSNEKWYASASDQEDEEHRDIYRDNPVLECVNQILLQNMNDNLNSPPKTPATERKNLKNKKVKFSDEEDKLNENILTQEKIRENVLESETPGYYETPIQMTPNFYETPQSIYSNDYEQILSKGSDALPITSVNKLENKQEKEINSMASRKLSVPKTPIDATDKSNHYYIDMDTSETDKEAKKARKSKIFRTPPALPPKPTTLIAKHKTTNCPDVPVRHKSVEHLDSEPDYCSISELNLPTNKISAPKKISVVAEVHCANSIDIKTKLETPALVTSKLVSINSDYDPVIVTDGLPSLINRSIEKLNIQTARQTFIKADNTQSLLQSPQKHKEPEIPKLPQVSEIIIPEETEESEHTQQDKKEERITIDNYVQNNSQILKTKNGHSDTRRGIKIGSSVSSLINDFNKRQASGDIIRKAESKLDKNLFLSFENLQNLDKHSSPKYDKSGVNESHTFDKFDLSQNFEEFKLDDCEIEEYNVDMCEITEEEIQNDIKIVEEKLANVDKNNTNLNNKTHSLQVDNSTGDINIPGLNKHSIALLKQQLQKSKDSEDQTFQVTPQKRRNEPTYEHFLECTGLSSKSILTPSRLLSNHKNMLKPKDVKLRSKVKANNLIERQSLGSVSTTKYWSEPYI